MLKPVLGLAASGVIAILLWKVVALFLLPLIGVTIGFLFLALKIGFIIAVFCLLFWVFRRFTRDPA
jgi:hypothetical protein